jgi:hypothetical protein
MIRFVIPQANSKHYFTTCLLCNTSASLKVRIIVLPRTACRAVKYHQTQPLAATTTSLALVPECTTRRNFQSRSAVEFTSTWPREEKSNSRVLTSFPLRHKQTCPSDGHWAMHLVIVDGLHVHSYSGIRCMILLFILMINVLTI